MAFSRMTVKCLTLQIREFEKGTTRRLELD